MSAAAELSVPDLQVRDAEDDSLSASATRKWRAAISAFVPPDGEWESLRAASLRFLDTAWLGAALAAGWDELELLGAFPSPQLAIVRRRGDCLGLVPALTLGVGCSIQSIDQSQAVVTRARTGARLVHRRELPGRQWARPWKAIETSENAQ